MINPGQVSMDEFRDLMLRLNRYGSARDRTTEREPRTITITDDEAMMLLAVMGAFHHPLMDQLANE